MYIIILCMDLYLSPGNCVYVEVHNGFDWCFGRVEVNFSISGTQKSCDSKYFIFNTALILRSRACVENQY